VITAAERAMGRQRRWLLCVGAWIVTAFLGALLISAPATAAVALTDKQRADIGRIESYLNKLKTMRARFLQVSSTGATAEGRVYVARPGRMRIEYEPPVPILIVADGTWLIYYDKELEQVSHVPLGSTPADILVRENIALLGDELTVTHYERGAHAIRVTLVRSDDPMEGSLTLVFSDRPLALRKWTVVDPQGVATHVTLMNARYGVDLEPELFRFRNPEFFGPPD